MRRPSLDISRGERGVCSKSSSVITGGVGGGFTSSLPFCLEKSNQFIGWLPLTTKLIWFEFVQNRTGNFDWKIPFRDQHAHYFLFLARTHKRILKSCKRCKWNVDNRMKRSIKKKKPTFTKPWQPIYSFY
jgi:hypothetical protein